VRRPSLVVVGVRLVPTHRSILSYGAMVATSPHDMVRASTQPDTGATLKTVTSTMLATQIVPPPAWRPRAAGPPGRLAGVGVTAGECAAQRERAARRRPATR
jgi:hypothetical protein